MINEPRASHTRHTDATGLPGALAASVDVFELIRIGAEAAADRVDDAFPTYATIATAAADGRDALLVAPSLQAAAVHPGSPQIDYGAAGMPPGAAGLADELASSLSDCASRASDPADRNACALASGAASRIARLLAPR
jgi:hypothetical protein